jgi:class 3 adenylate cyclase
MNRMIKRQGEKLQFLNVVELGDPVLTRSYDRFRVEKHGSRHVTVDNRRYISLASPLPLSAGQNWTLLIIVPEADFVGFVRKNIRKALLMSLAIVGLTAFLAGLLVWQGVRADRNAQLLLANRQQFESQSQAFSELANEVALFDPANAAALERVTDIIASAIQVRRVSIWRLEKGKVRLFCEDAYDRESDGHTQGNVLLRHDFVDFFRVLDKGENLILSDAGQDPLTAELHRLYLHPLGCNALLMSPIRLHGATVGALFIEGQSAQRKWSAYDETFAKAIAGMLALRYEANRELLADQCEIATLPIKQDAGVREPEMSKINTPSRFLGSAGRANHFYERMQTQGLNRERLGAEVFSHVAVMVLQFTNPFSLAETLDGSADINVLKHLVSHVEELASLHEVDYLKIMSSQMIGAAGLGEDDHKGLQGVASMALSIQDRCRHVFADLDTPMEFRMGLDMGPAIGSIVGEKENYYNLWGDAIITASLMAQAGVVGRIHVTESVYRHLQSQYVFKKRGTYYLAETGEIQTYLLASRL